MGSEHTTTTTRGEKLDILAYIPPLQFPFLSLGIDPSFL